MDKRTYNLTVGIILLFTSIAFFVMPSVLPIDAFIPVMLAIVCLIVALGFFFGGRSIG